MIALLYLILGFALAGFGGEAFVRGSVSLSQSLRIPTVIIGVTVAAFATSSPELSVSINAALAGKPQIALGDALGSCVVNISLVLGLALCFGALPAQRKEIRRDWFIVLLAPILIGVFAYDGEISRADGMILFLQFLIWLIWVITDTRRGRRTTEASGEKTGVLKATLYCIVGVGLLIAAGLSIVSGAKEIGVMFGIPTFVIGATLVALGTSMPELATTFIARIKGHTELGLGTILGSSVFNVFVIVAIASMIHPIKVTLDSLLVVLSFCLVLTLMTWPTKQGSIPRWRGFVFVVIYIAYVLLTVQAGE